MGDIKDQINVQGIDWLPENSSFVFCSANTPECEDDYKFNSRKVAISNETMAFKPVKGSLRVYRADSENSTTFYIGFKTEGEAHPILGEFGLIAGVVIALIVVGVILLIVVVILFFYYKKKHKKHHSKNKKDLNKKTAK